MTSFPELPITAEWRAFRAGETEALTSADGVRVQRAIESQGDGFRIRVRFVNGSGGAVRLETLSPAVIEGGSEWFAAGLAGWAVWLQGRQMTGDTFTHRFGRPNSHRIPWQRDRYLRDQRPLIAAAADADAALGQVRFRSHGMTMLHHAESGRSLLLGFVTTARQFGEIDLVCSTDERELVRIEARCLTEGQVIDDGGTLESESVVLLAGSDPLTLAEEYARILGQTMRARVPERLPANWCNSSFLLNDCKERDVLRALMALQTSGARVDSLEIGDHRWSAPGDWLLPDEWFPRGLRFLADRIRDAGYRPGLWLTPLALHRDSRVLAEHPEFALRDREGEIIWTDYGSGPCATLDCTHPGGRAWLAGLIRTMVHEWGFRILTLDELVYSTHAGARYHVSGTTAAMNLRACLEVIRAVAGEQTFIIGCSCPYAPAVGLVDAMRVGSEFRATWNNSPMGPAERVLRTGLASSWLNRRLWLTDRDCLTGEEPDISPVSNIDAQLLATAIALSGGQTALSDDRTALRPANAALAQRILPPTAVAARPLDLFARETPALWHLPRVNGGVIAFLNWDDGPVDLSVDLTPLGLADATLAVERWSETPRALTGMTYTERAIAPRSARVVRFVRAGGAPEPGGHILA